MKVIFLGISNKSDKKGKDLPPLDISTKSGQLIAQIDQISKIQSQKINLVPFTPTNFQGKIRLPTQTEINENLDSRIQYLYSQAPCLVFLLGSLVRDSILSRINCIDIGDGTYKASDNEIYFSPQYHPSYIQTYKRKISDYYVAEICEKIDKYK